MFELNGVLVLSAMSGYTDAEFCEKAAIAGANIVTLGGYNVDLPTCRSGARIEQRGRKESLGVSCTRGVSPQSRFQRYIFTRAVALTSACSSHRIGAQL